MIEKSPPIQSPKIYPLGDAAIVLEFGDKIETEIQREIRQWTIKLERIPFPGMIEVVPAYTTVTIYYNPWILSEAGKHDAYNRAVHYILHYENLEIPLAPNPPAIEIPVCYGNGFGPDLAYVAEYNQLSPEEVISIHSGGDYVVYMIGFAPGFPYLGGMNEKISTPRKSKPGLTIPPGSVGIAGAQTGIYPIETPGGWQLIGRTPLQLFNPRQNPPTIFRAGDRIRFMPISQEEFYQLKKDRNGASNY